MFHEDRTFVDGRSKFYQEHYRITEAIDPWHAYSQTVVHSTTRDWFYRFGQQRGTRILNAGSGGSDYGIKQSMVHLDLFESRIDHCEHRLVGDIAQIPAENSSFDVVLCVGSVINYADPSRAIPELARVLRPHGLLIIEYERSGSFEYLLKHGSPRGCCRVETFYGNVVTHVWVYGDGFFDGLLSASALNQLAESRFHALSSVALGLFRSPAAATRFTVGDQTLAQRWPFKAIASNRILAVEKLAD